MKTTFLLILTFVVFALQAQLKTGTIEMGITDFQMEIPEGTPEGFDMGEMMKGIKNVTHFKPGLLVQEMDMMGMTNTKTFVEGDSTQQYMDMMGIKWEKERKPMR